MYTLNEIGTIFEVRCPCGCQFTVDAVHRIRCEAANASELDQIIAEDLNYTTISCPQCKCNSFNFLYKHVIIRKEHPLYRKIFEKCQETITGLSKWSRP